MLEGDVLHKLVFTVLSGHVVQPTVGHARINKRPELNCIN